MKFMSILIKEGRKEDLQKKYSEKFKEYPEKLDFILTVPDLTNFNHKYTDFALKNLHPNASADEIENTVGLIKDFDRLQKNLGKKDINQYKSIDELNVVLNDYYSKSQESKKIQGAERIFEDNTFLVIKPKTLEASCKYGSNTKWCVTQRGTDYFSKYTKGGQELYFIINKSKSTNKNYSKIAIHFDNDGYMKYWDAQDSPMGQREIDVLEYAFPELIDSVKQDYDKNRGSRTEKLLSETFNMMGETSADNRNYLRSSYTLSTLVRGFQNNPDLGFGHSEARLSISLNSDNENKLIDEYQVFIRYKSKDEKTFTASIGFSGTEEYIDENNFIDLGLEDWGIDVTYNIGTSPAEIAEGVRRHIANRVLDHIVNNPKLIQKVAGTSKVWRADRANYGYTFGKNKGLIKKLVDYLDNGTIGTKLDFLESIGRLKSKNVNGKKMYSRSGGDYLPSSQFRGQFSSFFASAKMAGILNYRKIGKDFFLTKGPNFEAFKSGELKAL
jgi:hypothetical protein